MDEHTLVISPDLFWAAGFRSMTREQVETLLSEFYDTLETRVGMRVARQMSKNDLDSFILYVQRGDEQAAHKLIRSSVRNLSDTVAAEYDHLVAVLRRAAMISTSSLSKSE